MIKETTFNLTFGRSGINVSSQRPVDWSAGTYQPESVATGGSKFQYHRNHIRPSYVQDAYPTETGYESVEWVPVSGCTEVDAGASQLLLDSSCESSGCLHAWSKSKFIDATQTRTHNKYLTCSGDILEALGTCSALNTVVGLDAQNATGLQEFNGRLIIFTASELYLESAVEPYNFVPSLSSQAQAFGLKYPIGDIIELVHTGDYLYVLGTKGGVVGSCSGDSELPITFKFIHGFEGIAYKHNCVVTFGASAVYVWTHTGLGIIERSSFKPVESDISRLLKRGAKTLLHPVGASKYAERDNQPLQVRDCLNPALNSVLYSEHYVDSLTSDIAVYNLSSRLVAISYAKEGSIWTRILILDTELNRSSVLHIKHLTVYKPPSGYELLILNSSGIIQALNKSEGIGYVLFAKNFRSSGRAIKVPRINLHGDFNLGAYAKLLNSVGFQAPEASADGLSSIHASVGQDVDSTNNTRSLIRTYADSNTLQYTGMVIGNYVTLLIPFSGFLNSVKVQRA